MKRVIIFIMCIAGWLTASADGLPAFPGAEGFGMYTTGGRGGVVYHVTKLTDSGQGTFRYACEKEHARIIVFDVSGTIHLTRELNIKGNVTILGQTAPGDGICVADYPVSIKGDNVIIRYMRFRLGNKYVANHEGDGLGAMDHNNIIVDHCSVSWSIDECMSVYGGQNITVQWCIAAQSLKNAGHSKGAHGYGGNWGGSGATYHHNLICHNESRTPRLGPRPGTQEDERMDMRNNVIYNWGGNGCYGGEGMNVNIVNNYYKPGPCTSNSSATVQKRIAKIGVRTTSYTNHDGTPNQWDVMWHKWGTFYVDGNYNSSYADVAEDNWENGMYNQITNDATVDYTYTDDVKQSIKRSLPVTYYPVTTHSAKTAYKQVLNYAGACLKRDALDVLMVSDTRNGTATCTGEGNGSGIINTQDDVATYITGTESPWPTLATSGSALSVEDEATISDNGYANIENAANALVEDITNAQAVEGTLLQQEEEFVNTDPTEYTLSPVTHDSEWTFKNGYSISVTGKEYQAGSSCDISGIKYSKGTQYTINIPTGIEVTSVEFTGASNYDNTKDAAYLGEVNGNTYNSDEYPFPYKNGSTPAATYSFSFSTPVTNTLTFTPKGNQIVCNIVLYGKPTNTGISNIPTVVRTNNNIVYDLMGRRVANIIENPYAHYSLNKGIYIVNGRKIVVK